MKTIKELCKEIKGIYNIDGRDNTEITGISADSRKIERVFFLFALPVFMSTGRPLPVKL